MWVLVPAPPSPLPNPSWSAAGRAWAGRAVLWDRLLDHLARYSITSLQRQAHTLHEVLKAEIGAQGIEDGLYIYVMKVRGALLIGFCNHLSA
jgi:hypothetical protein